MMLLFLDANSDHGCLVAIIMTCPLQVSMLWKTYPTSTQDGDLSCLWLMWHTSLLNMTVRIRSYLKQSLLKVVISRKIIFFSGLTVERHFFVLGFATYICMYLSMYLCTISTYIGIHSFIGITDCSRILRIQLHISGNVYKPQDLI